MRRRKNGVGGRKEKPMLPKLIIQWSSPFLIMKSQGAWCFSGVRGNEAWQYLQYIWQIYTHSKISLYYRGCFGDLCSWCQSISFVSKVRIKLSPSTKFPLVTYFYKRAKDGLRQKTSLPVFQHQTNWLRRHAGHTSHPQLTGRHFKTE